METDKTLSNSSVYSTYNLSPDSSSPEAIYFCSLCDKPFTVEPSRDRHLRYCSRRMRTRPRSCRACNAAKTKCSFQEPCLRCTKKNIECVYSDSAVRERRVLPGSSLSSHNAHYTRPTASLGTAALSETDDIFSNQHLAFLDDTAQNESQVQLVGSSDCISLEPSSQTFSLNESLGFDEILAFEDYSMEQNQCLPDVSVALYDKLEQQSASWCAWMRRDMSIAVMAESPVVKPNLNQLATLQIERPHAQHSADLIIQSLRSFPTMMQRRETFPWFIHPQSQLLSRPAGDTLPEALSTCMGIAQMFTSRTSETNHFVWQTIRAEHCRFTNEMHNMSKFELLASVQACMIYLIMCVIDHMPEDEGNGLELLLALHSLSVLLKAVSGGPGRDSEPLGSNLNWENWMFAESGRRLANLWFLVGCVVCVKAGKTCDASQSYRALPLPGPKSLWEASTESAWEAEYEASRVFQSSGLVTLGDLVDLQLSDYTPSKAQRLDIWNAGVDNLGSLLNLVGFMT